MCYHKFYIFATCGHSFWHPDPLVQCPAASSSPSSNCQPRSHPYQTRKIYEVCWACGKKRDALLAEADKCTGKVHFTESQWRMKYQATQADENSWKTWGDGTAEASGRASGSGSNRGSRIGRMSDMFKAGWRKSGGSARGSGGGGGGGGAEKR